MNQFRGLLATQGFVGFSFDQPIATPQITGLGAQNLLETIQTVNPDTRYDQAPTSEMSGKMAMSLLVSVQAFTSLPKLTHW